MRTRSIIINGVLAVALAATVVGAVAVVGDSSAAEATEAQTSEATVGTVTATVSASGNASSAVSVGANFPGSGGTVTRIFVALGDTVTKGERLATVDDTSARQQLRSARASLASARAQLASVTEGPTSAEQAQNAASIDSAEVSLANARLSLQQAKQTQRLHRDQQDTNVAAAQQALDDATDPAAEDSARSALRQAKQTRSQTLLSDEQQVQNAQGQVDSAQASLESARANSDASTAPATQSSIDSAAAQVDSAEVQVDEAQTALEQTVLRAPVAGTVAAINGAVGQSSTTTGATTETASDTTTGFIVLTDLDELQVTTMVAEADASEIELGQNATVTFSAADIEAAGIVTAIDVTDTVTNNVVEYGVTVTLTDPPAGIKLGQTASVSITTESAENVLYVPANAVTSVGPVSTVTVRRNGTDETVTVETGIEGNNGTEIVSGLSEGDVVVLPETAGAPAGFTFPGAGGLGGIGGGLG